MELVGIDKQSESGFSEVIHSVVSQRVAGNMQNMTAHIKQESIPSHKHNNNKIKKKITIRKR